MVDITWQDPPKSKGGRGSGDSGIFPAEVRAALRDNPGRWALIAEDVHRSNAGNFRKQYGAEGFEFVTRAGATAQPRRRGDLYARYNPEGQR